MDRVQLSAARHAIRTSVLACAIGLTFLVPRARADVMPCDQLLHTKLQNLTVTSAYEVVGMLPKSGVASSPEVRAITGAKAGAPDLRDLPQFCRVTAISTPVSGSRIGIELWLPEHWNGKLLAIGNHGFAGEYEYVDMAMGLRRGYAVAATDTGHTIGNPIMSAEFSVGNPVAVDDYAWRAVHEMTLAAKALVQREYGIAARRAYFDGCSDGGREAMREAQQFPADYDGVIAGSAASYWTASFAADLWQFQSGALSSGSRMSLTKLNLAQKAAISACDHLDGVADGLIADPSRCRWDPRTLQCQPGADQSLCLTANEVAVIERVENSVRKSGTDRLLFYGMPPGSEALWKNMESFNVVVANYFRDMVVGQESWSTADALKADTIQLLRMSEAPNSPGMKINTTNPDLSAFRDRGGKIIQYHGWNDASFQPGFTTHYYTEVVDLQPGPDRVARTQAFYRLFMVPGMAHCLGGYGPTNFGGLAQTPPTVIDADHDVLEALDRWVEKGVVPDRLVATRFADTQGPQRQMPLCPFPKVAMYVGGDADRPESFACKTPDKNKNAS